MTQLRQYQSICVPGMLIFDNSDSGTIKTAKNNGQVTHDPGPLPLYIKDLSISRSAAKVKPLKSLPRDWCIEAAMKRFGTKRRIRKRSIQICFLFIVN
jgi:hypothetical protein